MTEDTVHTEASRHVPPLLRTPRIHVERALFEGAKTLIARRAHLWASGLDKPNGRESLVHAVLEKSGEGDRGTTALVALEAAYFERELLSRTWSELVLQTFVWQSGLGKADDVDTLTYLLLREIFIPKTS